MNSVVQQLGAFEQDMRWIDRHYDELKRRYSERFVAVHQQGVVDSDPELERLMNRLEKRYGEKAGRIAVKYITKKKVELIL